MEEVLQMLLLLPSYLLRCACLPSWKLRTCRLEAATNQTSSPPSSRKMHAKGRWPEVAVGWR